MSNDQETTTSQDAQCRGRRRDGQQCQGRAGPSGYCFAHDPALAGRRQSGNRQGGQNKARTTRMAKLVPSSLKPMLAELFDALDEVHRGDLPPNVATAMASLAGAITRVYESTEIEGRLRALEGGRHEQLG